MFRVIGGILLIIAGLPFVMKTDWFMQNFGSIAWAEQHMGGGGSWMFYKLLGILISLVGILMATGLLGGLLLGTVGKLFVPPT
jgi:hypothetical protein